MSSLLLAWAAFAVSLVALVIAVRCERRTRIVPNVPAPQIAHSGPRWRITRDGTTVAESDDWNALKTHWRRLGPSSPKGDYRLFKQGRQRGRFTAA